ncbi:MAG: (d)CMP kinase [Anaerolineales bacterium]|nr:(d)CMP kinase [Anaerolineales bacterium]MCS7247559.1 (d)CMP kinase [Anaerolineales bacterium]MDW8161370.1 (d)CMP kinase [Anaerolineales bacterium]MDW8447977.1 (d)CMP kinase [Anaerolineales bacterium]
MTNPKAPQEFDPREIITIDGPAASGKSTLAQRLAEALGYLYFDTGVMYRALTWLALQQGISVEDEETLTALAEKVPIEVTPPSKRDGRAYDVWIGDQDITWAIRHPQVDAYVSIVSSYPGVRRAMSLQQRRIGLRGKVVMVGRDIGTVVLPEAGIKIYLDASPEERARRRFKEMQARGEHVEYEEVLQSMRERDRIDSTRTVAPLRPAADAIRIDSNDKDIEQVLELVLHIVHSQKRENL